MAESVVVSALLLYKLVSFLINQPFFVELLVRYVKEIVDKMCLRLQVKNMNDKSKKDTVKILQTTKDGNGVRQFNFETGNFFNIE